MRFAASIAVLACGLGFANCAPVSAAESKPFTGRGFLRVLRDGQDVGCLDSKAHWNDGAQCHKYSIEGYNGGDDFFYIRSSPEINDYVFETVAWDNAQVSIRPRSFGEPSLFYNEEGVLLSMGTYFTTYYSTALLDENGPSTPIFSKEPKGQSFQLEIGWASE